MENTIKPKNIIVQVSELTSIDTANLQAMIIEGFMQFLDYQCMGDPWSISMRAEDDLIFKWWINQWLLIDKSFIVKAGESTLDNEIDYMVLHNSKNLKVYPNNCIYDNAYENLTQKFIQQYRRPTI